MADAGSRKESLRRDLRRRRWEHDLAEREEAGRQIRSWFREASHLLPEAGCWIAGYIPLTWEVDILPLFDMWMGEGFRIAVPAFDPSGQRYRIAALAAGASTGLLRGGATGHPRAG